MIVILTGRWLAKARTACCALLSISVLSLGVAAEADEPSAEFNSANGPGVPLHSGSVSAGAGNGAGNGGQYREGGFGTVLKIDQTAGHWIGLERSIVVFEAMPHILAEDHILFGDIRLSRAYQTELRMGGSGSVGYKMYLDEWNRTIGGAVSYQRDNFSGKTFDQIIFSAESLGEHVDVRGNYYATQGEQSKVSQISVVENSARFENFNIIFDRLRTVANAMEGFDIEAAVPITGDFGREHNVRIGAGFYYFDGVGTPEARGWKGRIEGTVIHDLAMRLEIANDDVFNTNVMFGVNWTYGRSKAPQRRSRRMSQRYRLTEPIKHLNNVVIANVGVIDANVTALNPSTGSPYIVYHVASGAAGPNTGSVTQPFATLQDAQAASLVSQADILFVHAGSSFAAAPNNIVSLNANDVVLGEGDGINHLVPVVGIPQPLLLPRATANSARPIFTGAAADGVTMAANSEFSGFDVVSPTGNGIVISGVSGVVVEDTRIFTAAGDGVQVNNVTGSVFFQDTEIIQAAGTGLLVSGGAPTMTFTTLTGEPGAGRIENRAGRALVVQDTTAGFVNMTGSSIDDDGGQGILLRDVAGTVTVDNASIQNSTTTGIDIQRGSGTFTFRNSVNAATVIDNPAGVGVNIGSASGNINFQSLTISSRNNVGINFGRSDTLLATERYSGTTRFSGDVAIDGAGGATPGVQFDFSTGSAEFLRALSVSGSTGTGITIGGSTEANPFPVAGIPAVVPTTTGNFSVVGTTTIDNATLDSILIQQSRANVTFSGTSITNRNARGIAILDNMEVLDSAGAPVVDASGNATSGVINFNGINTINNENSVALSGIDIQRNANFISFGTAIVNNTTGAPGVNITDNPDLATFPSLTGREVGFAQLDITAVGGGIGLFANQNPNMTLDIDSGTISATDAAAVDLRTTATDVQLTSVSATSAPTGINLVDITNPNSASFNFAVLGDGSGTANGSGGTIQTSNLAGEQGVFIQNAGNVLLRSMTFNTNRTHIEASTTALDPNGTDGQTLNLEFITATTSTEEGIDIIDTNVINILDSTLSNNGASGFGTIRMQISRQDDDYDWNILRNTITDATGRAIEIGPGVVVGSDLLFNISDNQITSSGNANGADDTSNSIILAAWNGNVTGTIQNNLLTHTGGSSEVIRLSPLSVDTDDLATYDIISNTISTTAGGDTAIRLVSLGNTQTTIQNNAIAMAGGVNNPNGTNTGMSFDLAAESDTRIIGNSIVDISEGTGIIFNTIAAPAIVQLDNNNVSITGLFGGQQEIGIAFLAVTGQVELIGNVNNVVNIFNNGGPSIFFFMPPGSNANGSQVFVNGFSVP